MTHTHRDTLTNKQKHTHIHTLSHTKQMYSWTLFTPLLYPVPLCCVCPSRHLIQLLIIHTHIHTPSCNFLQPLTPPVPLSIYPSLSLSLSFSLSLCLSLSLSLSLSLYIYPYL